MLRRKSICETNTRNGTMSCVKTAIRNLKLTNNFKEIPHKQAHKARSCACSLCFAE